MSASFIRAFFAIDLPVKYKQQLAVAMTALRSHLQTVFQLSDDWRWVKQQNLHLTLHFLGPVKEDEVVKLLQRVRMELAGMKSFYLHLGPLEWFPSSDRPQVLSLKAEPQHFLAELALALRKVTAVLNDKIEAQSFRGHVTLARTEGLPQLNPRVLSSFSWPDLPEIFINEIIFFRSDSQSRGSVYTRLASIQLEI